VRDFRFRCSGRRSCRKLWGMRIARKGALGLLLMTALAGGAGAGQMELISAAYHRPTYDAPASLPALSADGRYAVFASNAPNLAPGQVDTNNAPDLFLRDRTEGTTTLITHASLSPLQAASYPDFKARVEGRITADGRYVAFESPAVDLVPDSTGDGVSSIYLWDRVNGTTTLVSHASDRPGKASDDASSLAGISTDGDVLFISGADDLVDGQAGRLAARGRPVTNLFLWHRSADTLTLISGRNGSPSVPGDGSSWQGAVSPDGGFVVFLSKATDLLPGLTAAGRGANVFLYDRAAGTLSLISHASGSPLAAAGGAAGFVSLSADGRWIAFTSRGKNLIPGQTGAADRQDLFLYDRGSGETRLVSHRSGLPRTGDGAGAWMAMSADGRAVAFTSAASDLVPGQVDANGREDLFVYDRESEGVSLVTHAPGSPNTAAAGRGAVELRNLSADGRFLAFTSSDRLVAGQIGPLRAGETQVFLYDRVSRSTALASHGRESLTRASRGGSSYPLVSEDGGIAVFQSPARDLGDGASAPNGYDGLFVYDRSSGEVSPLAPPDPNLSSLTADGPSSTGEISADGRLVAFVSMAEGLTPGQIQWRGLSWNVFLHDRATGETRLLSKPGALWDKDRGLGGVSPVLSADGRYLAFVTLTSSVGVSGLLLLDLTREEAPAVLVNHGPKNALRIVGGAREPAISADGRYLAYACRRPERSERPENADVFLYDRAANASILVSHDAESPKLSADGRFVVFLSLRRVFLFDRATAAVTLVSHAAASPDRGADGPSGGAGISSDGRWIAFRSTANDLVPGQIDHNGRTDLFLYDRATGRTALVSHAASSPVTAADGESPLRDDSVSLSADGRWIVYLSAALDLVAGQTGVEDGAPGVFLYDRITGETSLVSHATGSSATAANRPPESPRISADGRRIAFLSAATDLVRGQTGGEGIVRLVLQDRTTGARTLVGRVRAAGPAASPVPKEVSFSPRMSADGRQVAFTTDAADLLPGDRNGTWDVYLYEGAVPGPLR
jgi:Tol biopolymer transport system component